MNEEIILSALVFASIALFCLAGYYYYGYLKSRHGILDKIQQEGATVGEPENPAADESDKSIKSAILRLISTLGNLQIAKPTYDPAQISLTFQQAGYQSKKAPIIFYGTKVFLGILLFIMFFLLRIIIPIRMGYFAFIVCSLVSCMIGYYLPNIWLKARIAGRKQRIQDGFPDALDLLVVSVEAGAGLDAAFARVGEEMRLTHEDLSNELQLMHRELKAGRSRRNALLALGLRVGLEDVNNLVILLNQSERFGTGIAQSLRVHSEFMRTKRSQRAEEMAAKLPVKMMIPLILFIFPAMLIVILGPAAIRIMRVLLTT